MDGADRTSSIPIEVPPELLPALRRAAREGVERATEYSEYSDEVHARIYEAARLWGAITHGTCTSADLATLADNAIRWTELASRAPTSLSALDALYDQLSTVRELIVLRDEARRAARWPELADDPGA